MFRDLLVRTVNEDGFKLRHLSQYARETATQDLADRPWAQTLIDAGPVDPVPFPARLEGQQQTWAF